MEQQQQKREASSSSQQAQPYKLSDNRGRIFSSRGRSGQVRCYTCDQSGHMPWDCPKIYCKTERRKSGTI